MIQGGNWLWTKQLGSSLNDYAFGIAIDQNGFAYVGGHSKASLMALQELDYMISLSQR